MHRSLDRELHYWGTHICTDNGKTYATKKSYSVGANIKECYVSPVPHSNTPSAPKTKTQLVRIWVNSRAVIQALGEEAFQSNWEFIIIVIR